MGPVPLGPDHVPAEERYQSLFRNHPHGVFGLDLDGRVVEVNPAAGRTSGYTPDELLQMDLMDLLVPEDVERTAAAFQRVLQREPQEIEVAIRHRDGRLVDVVVTGLPLIVDDQVHGIYGIVDDVSDRLRIARELEVTRVLAVAASEAKSDFVARMSHEVRTPLTSILATVELLAVSDDEDERRTLVDTLGRSGTRLLTLVESVLDFGAAGVGDARVMEDFDLHQLVRDAVALAATAGRSKGLEVTLTLSDDVPRRIRDHPTWTTQILVNLLSNAVEHTASGHVRLAVSVLESTGSGVHVVYRVDDSGVGIDPADHDGIFEPFHSLPRAGVPSAHRPTGLGLSIVKQLVTIAGGSVALDSAPGRGSTFTVVMPAIVADEADPRRDPGQEG